MIANVDDIMDKYLLKEESITQYWNKIPPRARLMIMPIVKLQTVSGKDWDEITTKCNKETVLKISSREITQLFKELEKVKFVSVKESPGLIAVSITEIGKKKNADFLAHIEKERRKPATPYKFSKETEKELSKYYEIKPGQGPKWTGD